MALAALAMLSVSCAKTVNITDNEAAQRVLGSYIHMYYPELEDQEVGNGIYVMEDVPGPGEYVDSATYIKYNYKVTELYTGKITSYNSVKVAQQRNEYDPLVYYGPATSFYAATSEPGLYEIVRAGYPYDVMRAGGRRKAIIPGWIYKNGKVYETPEEYIKKGSKGTPVIIDLEVLDVIYDMEEYQIDTIETYMTGRKMLPLPDTTGTPGFYFMRNKLREQQREVTDSVDMKRTFPTDTTIYIEYVGRLLNGRVFDTNIKDTAVKHGLASKNSTYSPTAVKWGKDSLSITMGGNSVIKGFSQMLWKMHPYESADAVFTSTWGYGTSGSGKAITAYAPLLFEVNIVKKPESK